MTRLGFSRSKQDRCLFFKRTKKTGKLLLVMVYVDDLMCLGTRADLRDLEPLLRECFETNVKVSYEEDFDYLGMQFNMRRDTVGVSMPGYVSALVQDFGIKDVKLVEGRAPCPHTHKLFVVNAKSPLLSKARADKFRSGVMRLLYLTTRVRPDLKLHLGVLTSRLKAPTEDDYAKFELVLRHLAAMPDRGLVFRRGEELKIEASADASHGSNTDGKGQVGYRVSTGSSGAGVIHASRKSSSTSTSSAVSEVQALYQCVVDTVRLRRLAEEVGFTQATASTVEQDNLSAIRMMERGPGWGGASKAMDLRFYWVTEQIDSGKIQLKYVPTAEILADGFTKPITAQGFAIWQDKILGTFM